MRAIFVLLLLLIPAFCSGAETNVKGDSDAERLGAPSISEAEECRDRIEAPHAPIYPSEAFGSRTEGWVVVDFELSSEGKILSRKVESEKPTGVFGQSALNSIEEIGFNQAAGPRKCRMLYTYTIARVATREPVSLYCDGNFLRDGTTYTSLGVAALMQISANDFRLDFEGFGHGEGKGKLKRKNAFDLSGTILFTPSTSGIDSLEASLVLQKYTGALKLHVLGAPLSTPPLYSGKCTEKRPIVDSAD